MSCVTVSECLSKGSDGGGGVPMVQSRFELGRIDADIVAATSSPRESLTPRPPTLLPAH